MQDEQGGKKLLEPLQVGPLMAMHVACHPKSHDGKLGGVLKYQKKFKRQFFLHLSLKSLIFDAIWYLRNGHVVFFDKVIESRASYAQ